MDLESFLASCCKWRRSVLLERRHFQQEARKERVSILSTCDARFYSLNIRQKGRDKNKETHIFFCGAKVSRRGRFVLSRDT